MALTGRRFNGKHEMEKDLVNRSMYRKVLDWLGYKLVHRYPKLAYKLLHLDS